MTGEGSPPAYTIASSELHDDNQLRRVVKYGVLIEVVCAMMFLVNSREIMAPSLKIWRQISKLWREL